MPLRGGAPHCIVARRKFKAHGQAAPSLRLPMAPVALNPAHAGIRGPLSALIYFARRTLGTGEGINVDIEGRERGARGASPGREVGRIGVPFFG